MFGRRQKNRRHGTLPEIQITPFIDVVLVLLIIFMIATPMMISGVDVSLPEGSAEFDSSAINEPIAVSLTKDNMLYVDKELIDMKSFVSAISIKTAGNKDRAIFIKGDKEISYGEIMNIMHILNKNGYNKAILVTEE